MHESQTVRCRSSLANAVAGRSTANYSAIVEGFAEKGIPADTVRPRENVFTINAWGALGRRVRDGETGIVVVTYVGCKGKRGGGSAGGVRPVRAQLFHESQTEAIRPRSSTFYA